MATELLAPFITLDKDEGHSYLAAHFTWGEAVEAAFRHEIDDGNVLRATTPADFAFFDGRGFRVTVAANDNTVAHVVDPVDLSGDVRTRVGEILEEIAPDDVYLNPFPDVVTLPYDTNLSFVAFGMALAAALRAGPPGLDPHRRGWWHNLCHRIFR